jgi:uncharacterized RDD family membrane protein YckC
MKRIEIITAQNVTIIYNTGLTYERILAYSLDLIFTLAGSSALYLILSGIFPTKGEILVFFTYVPVMLVYHIFMEYFTNGQSFGKRIMHLKVLRLNGEQLGFFDCLMRWIFRIPDILFSGGILAVLMITSSAAAQRLGDFLADTVVIKTTDSDRPDVNWLLKMNEQNPSWIPVYPGARNLSESDILLIKEVIDRHRDYQNKGSREAVLQLTSRLEQVFGVKSPPNKIEFLTTIIRDYVYITR